MSDPSPLQLCSLYPWIKTVICLISQFYQTILSKVENELFCVQGFVVDTDRVGPYEIVLDFCFT